MIPVSIVVPVLNEAPRIGHLLRDLRAAGTPCEIIVVDGGSRDATVALARPLADRLLQVSPGRAAQLNAGAAVARGRQLWFVHADTELPGPVDEYLRAVNQGGQWGFFRLRLSGRRPAFRLIERCICWRSRATGVVTGDQGLFVRRALFERLGGYADLPLMEDVELTKRLRRMASPTFVPLALQSSSRRWEVNGLVRTVLLMWRLRLRYFLGADPAELARDYGTAPARCVHVAGLSEGVSGEG